MRSFFFALPGQGSGNGAPATPQEPVFNDPTLATVAGETTLFSSTLSDMYGMVNNLAGATYANGKLHAQATNSGWDNELYPSVFSTQEEQAVRTTLTLNTLNTQVNIGKNPRKETYGSAAGIDFNTGNLIIWRTYTSTPPTVIAKQKTCAFAFEAGKDYALAFEKVEDVFTLKVTDIAANVSDFVSATFDELGGFVLGNARGYPFVNLRNGDISLRSFAYKSLVAPDVKFVMAGDSITDGFNFVNEANGNWQRRYASQVNTAYGAANIGCAGDTSQMLLARTGIDLMHYQPQYVHVLIGTNDTTYSTWETNVQQLITKIQQLGAVPIFGTVPPANVPHNTTYSAKNAWIKASGYRYVNYAAALSVGGDEATMDTSLFLSDLVHPNVAGHDAMFARFQSDLADLL